MPDLGLDDPLAEAAPDGGDYYRPRELLPHLVVSSDRGKGLLAPRCKHNRRFQFNVNVADAVVWSPAFWTVPFDGCQVRTLH